MDEQKSNNDNDIEEDNIRNLFHLNLTVADLDIEEDQNIVETIFDNGCGCKNNCIRKFNKVELLETGFGCEEMKYYCRDHVNHHHQFIKGALNALVRTSESTMKKDHTPAKRKSVFTEYRYRDISVCQTFFQFVNCVTMKELKNIRKSFLADGTIENMHKNSKKIVSNKAFSLQIWENVIKFIRAYGIQHGLILPGRIPEFRNFIDLIVLPSVLNKSSIYAKYLVACKGSKIETVSKRSWYRIWEIHCSNIVIQKPKTDLCVTCRQSIVSFNTMHNLSESEKKLRIEQSLTHLTYVEKERQYYKDCIERCKHAVPEIWFQQSLRPHKPLQYYGAMHYSFDYAQQVSLPQDPLQVGPTYFLSGYKIGLFGVAIEPMNRFISYVIPESCAVSKGANAIISLLHHCFENFSLGKYELKLHADNCVGQNKNNYVLQYITYRVCSKRNHHVELAHLPVGHTKFSPDAYFGLFKQQWKRSRANCVRDVIRIASKQANTTVVLVGNESGEVFVPTYDWVSFFEGKNGKRIKDIRLFHNFSVYNGDPRILHYKESNTNESNAKRINMFPGTEFHDGEMPNTIPVNGLTPRERQQYLFKSIRPYITERYQNVLCPKPFQRQTKKQ